MGSREGLYKKLINSAPYGTLFFFHNVCLECNPSAERLLGCHRDRLIGSAIDQIRGDETPAWLDLKVLLKQGARATKGRLKGKIRRADGHVELDIVSHRPDPDGCELVVTLFEQAVIAELELPVSAGALVQDTESWSADLPMPSPYRQPASSVAEAASLTEEEVTAEAADRERNACLVEGSSLTEDATLAEGSSLEEGFSQAEDSFLAEARAPFVANATVLSERQQVYLDSLTGLPNRQFLIDSLNGYLVRSRGDQTCAALLMIDLDNFKDINDSWGHSVGDQVIRKIGSALARTMTEGHLLARLSGDEFLLFIPQMSGGLSRAARKSKEQAEHIREVVAAPLFHDGHELALTASIGIALIADNPITAERALQYADSAMYEAKRKGRNGIAFFDPCITEKAKRQIGLNTRLRKAIDNQEFALHIQPQLSVATGELIGGEALLRWVSSENGNCAPAEFIPVLEASGLIVNVGHWVIRTACEYLRSYLDAGLWQDHMRLGINISPRQFLDPQLFDVVSHSLSSYQVNPRYINFEITENLLIHDIDDVISKMKRLKSLGAQFSVDDFGIGYSSMIYLKRLPFDHLKIDREFIYNIHRDQESRGVVEAIMAVSRQYGLQVTAEGVENFAALEILRSVGCDHYQGAYYSMPVSPERFLSMLTAV